jgi:hypothetical protein
MFKKIKPEDLLLLVAFFLLVLAFIIRHTIDVHLHDTYYVIGGGFLFIPFAILLSLYSLVYRLARNAFWSGRLIWIHVLLSILSLLVFFGFILRTRFFEFSSRHQSWDAQRLTLLSFFSFVLTQLIFLINLVGGLINRISKRS